jgi:predicted nucleotidyltransferase component of viral defense system
MPGVHADGKWRLTYAEASGGSGHVELDINFLLRAPLWPRVESECRAVGSFSGAPTTVLDVHELAAGKLAALLARSASRDIFDSRALLSIPTLDELAKGKAMGRILRQWGTGSSTNPSPGKRGGSAGSFHLFRDGGRYSRMRE